MSSDTGVGANGALGIKVGVDDSFRGPFRQGASEAFDHFGDKRGQASAFACAGKSLDCGTSSRKNIGRSSVWRCLYMGQNSNHFHGVYP
jgi:hypothetical protein